jgi:tRNA pseudouridine32 synthase/23S rRNA pseudouridine746 synthase
VLDFLAQRFPNVDADEWFHRMAAGDVVDDQGQPVAPACTFQAARRLYYFRSLPSEQPIPFEAEVLWQNEHLLVVDKPHFLPVLPSGKYLQETVLVRLKNALGLEDLSPIHRLDRDTAGLVLFSVQRASRAAYHNLFRKREVDKTYEAIAPRKSALPWPVSRASRIIAGPHFMQQIEVPGEPNTLTYIDLLEAHGELARYQLKPVTGHRHQLRVHMAALGLPLVGDGIYPMLTPEGSIDYRRPLQLLARAIAFTDPMGGEKRSFQTRRKLRSFADIEEEIGS